MGIMEHTASLHPQGHVFPESNLPGSHLQTSVLALDLLIQPTIFKVLMTPANSLSPAYVIQEPIG